MIQIAVLFTLLCFTTQITAQTNLTSIELKAAYKTTKTPLISTNSVLNQVVFVSMSYNSIMNSSNVTLNSLLEMIENDDFKMWERTRIPFAFTTTRTVFEAPVSSLYIPKFKEKNSKVNFTKRYTASQFTAQGPFINANALTVGITYNF